MRFVSTVPKEVYVIYYVFISPELLTHDSSSFYPLWLDQRQMKISEERHVMLTESSVLKRDAYTLEKPELNLKRPTHHLKAPLAGAAVGGKILEYGTVSQWRGWRMHDALVWRRGGR